MALSANKKLEASSTGLRFLKSGPGYATTFYVGELVGIEPSQGYVKPISGSAESGYQVVGIITKKQVIATSGDKVEYEAGHFVLSGSGFAVDEVNKIVYADDSTTMYDAHSAGRHAVGRMVNWAYGSSTGNNIIVDVASVRSGTST